MLKHYVSWKRSRAPSKRSRSYATAGIAVLTTVAFTLASVGAQPYERLRSVLAKHKARQTPPTGPMMAMPLIAPLFLQDAQFSSTISLVNASSVHAYATIIVRSLSGQTILQKQVSLAGSFPAQIPVQQLLQEANSSETRGSILVEQSPDLRGSAVLAQLSITYQGSLASYIDEELAMPDPAMGSSILRGVARGKGETALVAVSSLSETSQKIELDCLGGATSTSKTLELPANATVITNACGPGNLGSRLLTDIPEENTSSGSNVVGVQLISNAGPAEFAAFGLTRRHSVGDLLLGGVPFTDPKLAVSSSTVFAGVPVGAADLLGPGSYKPYVAIANFSMHAAHTTVKFSQTAGAPSVATASAVPVGDVELQPQRTKIISLTGIQGDPGLRNSFVVTSDAAPGDIAVSMASKALGDGGEVELLGKDAQQPENAGAHPWSIANGNESTLLVFNHTDQPQHVVVTVLNGTALWQKLVKLSPFETFALSMTELINNQVPDDRRKVLPPDLVEGEIIWTMAAPKTITGRLLVSNRITAMARNFSCNPTYVLCGASLSPGSATVPVNGTATFTANYSVCLSYNGQCSGSAASGGISPNYSWSGGGSIFTQTCSGQNSCTPTGTSPGTALLTVYVSSGGCSSPAQSNVTVTPRIDSVSPSRGLIGATTSHVTINGQGFTGGHVNTPSAIQVSNITTFTDTQIVFDAVISSTATPGKNAQAIYVTASSQDSNKMDFYVQVPTSLSMVGGTASGTTERICGTGVCGTIVSFKYQVNDQDTPTPQAIRASMSMWDSFADTFNPDNLHLQGTTFFTTCPNNTGPCNVFTQPDGTFTEGALGACSTDCWNGSACKTGGPSGIAQTWHIASSSIVQQVSEYCEKVLVNGTQVQ